jgi:uncharacterized membrane protein HdeD (DUF308 family)
MLDALAQYWWAFALRGVAAVIFGILALIWPDITLFALVLIFGAYALVDGLFTLGAAIFGGSRATRRRPWLILEGIIGIAIGVLTFLWPGITTLALLWLIAAWALVTGVLEIVTAIRLRRELQGEWMLALSGVLSVLFGILLAVWPATGALAVAFLIGIYAIAFGIALVVLSLRLRKEYQHRAGMTDVHRPATA